MLLKRNGTFDGSVLNAFFIDENKIYFIFKSVRRSFANRNQSMQYQFGEKADLVRIACQKIYNTHNTILYNYFLQKKLLKPGFFSQNCHCADSEWFADLRPFVVLYIVRS